MGRTVLMNIILILLITTVNLFASQFNTSTSAPLISIYQELEAEPRLDALSVQFQYGIPSSILTTTLLNGGTATTSNSEAVLATSGAVGAVAGLQSKTAVQYRSGHQADAYFTVAFTGAIAANTKQYIGILSSSDGFGVGYNGTTFGIVLRNNGTDTFIPQSSFNGDTINGAGSSGFNYNSTLLNVFHIAYGWLGASIIQFQVMSSSGAWVTFHTIQYPNSSATPSIANALLPISAQVYDPSGGHSLQLTTASWNMDIVGIQSNVANRFFSIQNQVPVSGAAEVFVLTIQNSNTYQSSTNRMNIQLQRYFASNFVTAVAGSLPLYINIYKNATVTGTSFSSVNGNSIAQYSSTGTYTAGTGILMIAQVLNTRGFNPEFIDLLNTNIILYPGETLTMTAISSDGSAINVRGGFNWAELF